MASGDAIRPAAVGGDGSPAAGAIAPGDGIAGQGRRSAGGRGGKIDGIAGTLGGVGRPRKAGETKGDRRNRGNQRGQGNQRGHSYLLTRDWICIWLPPLV